MPIESDRIPLDETEGKWVLNPRTRILEWRYFPPPTDAEPPIQNLVACPFCNAGIGQACRTKNGNPVALHSQRIKARRKQWTVHSSPELEPPKCGTDSGYYAHIRRFKESACLACRTAHAKAERERKERAA